MAAVTPEPDQLADGTGLAEARRRRGRTASEPLGSTTAESTIEFVARQSRHLLIASAVIVVVTAAAMIAMANVDSIRDRSVAYLVFLVGTVGGVANNHLRLRRMIERADLIEVGRAESRLVAFQIYASPLIAGVFALTLYGIFMSGSLLAGSLFPSFGECASAEFTGVRDLADCVPATNSDVAKALVWSFAAGFLERLVPNLITTLTRANGSEG